MKMMGLAAAAFAVGAFAVPGLASAQTQSPTFDAIRARGQLNCSTAPNSAGFSLPDSAGVWRGLDVDFCRAVAAAIFGDGNKVRIVPSTSVQRFPMLQSGEIDLLVRSTTWTLGREASLGFLFAGINFYDGTGFLVKKASGVTSARQLNGATVCVAPGTTTELALTDYFRSNNMRLTPVVIENAEEIQSAFISGRCDAYTNDASGLATFRATRPNAEDFVLLPEIISKEPLGPVVRKGDFKYFDIVRWTYFALITAEELGITQANIDTFANSANPDVQRFMGKTGDLGKALGLEPDWAVKVIKAVGNFGETWDRNMTPLGVPRGINNLWTKGGLLYAPPMR